MMPDCQDAADDQPRRAAARAYPPVSLIVPTYCEALNIPQLVEQIDALRSEHGLDLELILVDDDSPDDTAAICARLNKPWLRLLIRKKYRGLATAVLHGFEHARHDHFVVMDADLSHPPSAILSLLDAIADPSVDLAIGSRYAPGGSTDENWGLARWINSKIATLLARPFTAARDPMAGMLAIRRATFERADRLNPVGYKIALELIVKCPCPTVREIPIHFSNRKKGHSKLNLHEQLNYLRHIKRLSDYRFGLVSQFTQFALVGVLGTIVNLATLTVLLLAKIDYALASAIAIWVSMSSNFQLNRLLTFSSARIHAYLPQYFKFALSCLAGMAINYLVANWLVDQQDLFNQYKHLASLAGVGAGMTFNFLGSRFWVFKLSKPATEN